MRHGGKVLKDKTRRKLFFKVEQRRLFLKALVSNEFCPLSLRKQAQNYLMKLVQFKTTRIKNRCIESSRTRAVYRSFKLARSRLHFLAGMGILPGVKRASW